MKKYRLEIPEELKLFIEPELLSENNKVWEDWTDEVHKTGWLKPVYICNECGEEIVENGGVSIGVKSICYECMQPKEPEFRETTAEEWQKENAKRIKDQVVDDRRYIDIGDTAYYKAALMGIEVGIAEGIRRNEWKHRERQTFEEYCNNRKLGWSIWGQKVRR